MQNYDYFIERIAKSAGLDVEEVDRRVEAKKAKLSGLISKEGAAQIVAAELGINFEEQNLKIGELAEDMRKANVLGKIIKISPVREFDRNGRKGKVVSFVVADETANTRAVLWDVNHISLIESGEIGEGDSVEIRNASVRAGEIHLGSFSELKKSSEVFSDVKTEEEVLKAPISEIKKGQKAEVKGTIVGLFPPRLYFICPKCSRKVILEDEKFICAEHGEVEGIAKSILNFVLDDGTESIRVVLFSDQINELIPEEDLRDAEKFGNFREDFLGSEVSVRGIAKQNRLFGNLEIIAEKVLILEAEELILELDQSL